MENKKVFEKDARVAFIGDSITAFTDINSLDKRGAPCYHKGEIQFLQGGGYGKH